MNPITNLHNIARLKVETALLNMNFTLTEVALQLQQQYKRKTKLQDTTKIIKKRGATRVTQRQ